MTGIRLLIVDDVTRVRQDLSSLLSLYCEVEIVGEAANGLEAIQQAEALQPHVILMDLEMPVLDGYQARQRADRAGVDAFIVKGAPLESLVEAILERKE